jgi:methylated-DNA-[protein]-cysteine S-methyltransferase
MPLSAYQAKLATPMCVLGVRTANGALTDITFLPRTHREVAPVDALAEEACRQLQRYIEDPGFRFKLPVAVRGTDFQRRVWAGIAAIPKGVTRTYGELAADLRSAPRAVGQACGSNPIPLVVPCHRVVSASGLGGFAHHDAGFLIGVKRWLLAHEAAAILQPA